MEVRTSPGKGYGLYTTMDIPKDCFVLKFVGKKLTCSIDKALPDWLQIGKEEFLVIDNLGFFINHSCSPNCRIAFGADTTLVTIRDIKRGEELSFDYSTTSTDNVDTWKMDCCCGIEECRRIITGYKSLPSLEKYKALLAPYLE